MGFPSIFLDDAASLYLLDCQRTARYHLLDEQTVARVIIVEKHAQTRRCQCRTSRTIATPRVRGVEFAKHFRQHVAEIVVVVDVGQKALVGLAVGLPIDSVQVWGRRICLLPVAKRG